MAYARDVCSFKSSKVLGDVSGYASERPEVTMDLLHYCAVFIAKGNTIRNLGGWLRDGYKDCYRTNEGHPKVPRIDSFLAREETAAKHRQHEQDEKQKRLKKAELARENLAREAETLAAKLADKEAENKRLDALAASFESRDSKQHDAVLGEYERGNDWRSATHLKAWIKAGKPESVEELGWKFIPILAEAEEIFLRVIQPEIEKMNQQARDAKNAGEPYVDEQEIHDPAKK